MEQQRALNALAPYLALSSNARTPAAAVDLIHQAIQDPSTYIFAELLQTPQIQALRSDATYSTRLTQLEIFSWGTWHDYVSTPGLPDLSERETKKLKLLSLVSLVGAQGQKGTEGQRLKYEFLMRELDLQTQAELEQLLTGALSAGLVTGTLDPLHSIAAITSVAPLRDLPPGSAPKLVSVLEDWEGRCDGALKDIDAWIQQIRTEAEKRGKQERRDKEQLEERIEGMADDDEERNGKRLKGDAGLGKKGGLRSGDDVLMELDDNKAKGRSKKFFGRGNR